MPVLAPSPSPSRAGHAAPRGGLAGPAWLAVAIVATLPLFRFGLEGLADAWSRPEFSHGPVIPVLSFYMFLREMKAVPPPSGPVTDRWPGVAVILLALGLAALGNLVRIDHLVFYALIVWVAGLVLVGFGWRRGIVFWPSVLHLVFMLPLPQFLYWKVNTTLQLVSSEIGVKLVALAGVPVYLEGNVIDLGVTMLQVAEACSGLRYLFPIMSFTYVFAVLYRGPLWHKLVLLLLAVPVAVVMNAVRIGVIGLLVDRFGVAQAEGFLHVFEGWVVFLSCIALLLLLVKLMQRLVGDRRRLGDALDLDFSGLGAEIARVRFLPASRALVTAALATAALGLAWSLVPAREAVAPPREPYALFPREVDGWSGSTQTLAPGIARVLGADDYLSALYTKPGAAAPVELFMSWYDRQGEGAQIHSPEVCLPGAGWEVFRIEPVTVPLPGTATGSVHLNRVVIQKGLERQLVYYWFQARGGQYTGDFAARFANMRDSVTLGRTDGGLVRLITPIGTDGVAAADARLRAFLAASVDEIPRFIPGRAP